MGKKRLKYRRRQYILNFASTILSQLECHLRSLEDGPAASIAEELGEKYGNAVRERLRAHHSPATLGKLADCGIGKDNNPMAEADLLGMSGTGTTMVQAMGSGYLNERKFGCDILLDLATAALVAAMADALFLKECQRKIDEHDRYLERMLTY